MKINDLLLDDESLDQGYAALGVPAAGLPKTSAASILSGATAGAVVTGVALWKVFGLMVATAVLGLVGGYAVRDVIAHHQQSTPVELEETFVPREPPAPAVQGDGADAAGEEVVEPPGQAAAPSNAGPRWRDASGSSRGAPISIPPGHTYVPPPGSASSPLARLDPAGGAPEISDFVVVPTVDDSSIRGVKTSPLPPPLPEPDPGAASSRVEAPPVKRPGGRSAVTRLRIEGGAVGPLGAWGAHTPALGGAFRLGLLQLGPTRSVARLEACVEIDTSVLPGDQTRGTRGVFALQAGLGLALGRGSARLDLGWNAGLRLMLPTTDARNARDPGAGWFFVASGPRIGLAVNPRVGPTFHVEASVQGSVLDLDRDGTAELLPWFGLVAGVELPVAGER